MSYQTVSLFQSAVAERKKYRMHTPNFALKRCAKKPNMFDQKRHREEKSATLLYYNENFFEYVKNVLDILGNLTYNSFHYRAHRGEDVSKSLKFEKNLLTNGVTCGSISKFAAANGCTL